MIKETCKVCNMTIQAASNEDADSLKKSMEAHVQAEHGNPVAKHKLVLDDSAAFIQNFITGKKNTKKSAKSLLQRINELTNDVDLGSLPSDEELELEESTKPATKKTDAKDKK